MGELTEESQPILLRLWSRSCAEYLSGGGRVPKVLEIYERDSTNEQGR